jgi:hypothetical protein
VIKRTIGASETTPDGGSIFDLAADYLPLDCHHLSTRCPTVYGEEAVIRHLTIGELLSIFNIPSSALPDSMRDLLHLPVPDKEARAYPFLSEAPLKVLHKTYERWHEVPYTIESVLAPMDIHPTWTMPGVMYSAGESSEVEAAY